MPKVVINVCFGGFGLSTAAYERLIELGVPCRAYIEQVRNPKTKLYEPEPRNEGRVIFDRRLSGPSRASESMEVLTGTHYWDGWFDRHRDDQKLVQVVEELGGEASGFCAKLKVVEVPDGVEWEIHEHDGAEHVSEFHRTWR